MWISTNRALAAKKCEKCYFSPHFLTSSPLWHVPFYAPKGTGHVHREIIHFIKIRIRIQSCRWLCIPPSGSFQLLLPYLGISFIVQLVRCLTLYLGHYLGHHLGHGLGHGLGHYLGHGAILVSPNDHYIHGRYTLLCVRFSSFCGQLSFR